MRAFTARMMTRSRRGVFALVRGVRAGAGVDPAAWTAGTAAGQPTAVMSNALSATAITDQVRPVASDSA